MRGDLTKIDGVSAIETDVANQLCTFKFAGSAADIKAELDKLADQNQHVAGFGVLGGLDK